eukprot:2104864-Pleurochrysis_carterae.AAC.1
MGALKLRARAFGGTIVVQMQRKNPLKLQRGRNGGGKIGNGEGKTLNELAEEVEALEELYKERLVARERARAAEVEAGGRATIARMSRDVT